MFKWCKFSLLILLALSLSLSAFANEETNYYKGIYVNINGNLITEKPFHKILGPYLFSLNNQNIIRTKSKDNLIFEFTTQKESNYVIYNENAKVRELGEIGKYRQLYHYNNKGFIKRIDDFIAKDDRVTIKYLIKNKTIFIYNNKNYLIRKETYNISKEKISEIVFKHDENGNIIKIEDFDKNKLITLTTCEYKNNKIITKKIFENNQLIKNINYQYDSNNNLIAIKPTIYKVSYFQATNVKTLNYLNIPNGIASDSLEFNNEKEIIAISGVFPNIQSYITYNFNVEQLANMGLIIHTNFINHSVKDKTILNTLKIFMTPKGNEFKTLWFNHKGEELFNKLPMQIKFTKQFNIFDLLNTKYVIFGEVLTEKKSRIKNEIIVELYNKLKNRTWCHFANGYYFYLIKFSDEESDYNKIQILKAGYQYETINFSMNKNKTLQNLSPTYLKTALKKR
ncbi:MAG: hypothetical protein OEV44_02075 [Spirochaetota bacterium]|nr:hypothetical protein [Spirochaetota bacterium]